MRLFKRAPRPPRRKPYLLPSLQSTTVSVSSDTTDGADVLSAAVGAIVAASSATTDGADTLSANVGPLVALSSATTDGADVLVANVAPQSSGVSMSSATTDGADVLNAQVGPLVAASSSTTDGADVLVANVAPLGIVSLSSATTDGVDTLAASLGTGNSAVGGGGGKPKRRYVQRIGDRLVIFTDPVLAINAGKRAEKPVQVPIEEIKTVAKAGGQAKKVLNLLKSKDYEQMVSVYEQIMQEQDEQDVEMLLLSL